MISKQNNFVHLLAGLLFLLLVMPLIHDLSGIVYGYVSELAFSVFLIIGIWSFRGSRSLFRLAVMLVVIGIVSNILALANAGFIFSYLSLGSYIAFLSLAISLATRQVFRSEVVDANRVIGAICIYMLIGVIWSLFYVLVNLFIPGSYSGHITGSIYEQLLNFLYFSFVTLTSLGYGDITPVSTTARALATGEVIFGQFYMTILVAGLVAAYMQKSDAE